MTNREVFASMLALGFSITLALFWTLLGQAVLIATRSRVGVLRSWLLAPALGVAVTVLMVMIVNQAGIPVDRFAWPLTLFLGLAAACIVARGPRPPFPVRAALPIIAAVGGFFLLAGIPFWTVGFHWTSYVNDDYLNYSLAAERFRRFGYFRAPTVAELSGRDYTQYYWFMHAMSLMRCGAEETVAWAASLLNLRAIFAFMPTQLAMAAAQIMAAAGLVLHRGRWRRAAQAAALLLAATPMFMFGFIYQLIAQVGGLPLMLAFVAFATRRWRTGVTGRELLAAAIPTALAGGALAIFYPEVSPFGWIAIGLYTVSDVIARRTLRPWPLFWAWVVALAAVLLRYNLLSYYLTLSGQLANGVFQRDLTLSKFPFFLLPSGLSALFGFQILPGFIDEPWASIFIAVGGVLLVTAALAAVVLAWRREPVGGLLLVNLALGAMLFRRGNDFGLYKLAMYLQPALMGVLAWRLARRPRFGGWRAGLLVVYVALTLPIDLRYVRTSLTRQGALINELMGASRRAVHMPALSPPAATWASGLNNVAAAKIAAERYRGSELRFLDMDYFGNFFHPDAVIPPFLLHFHPARSDYERAPALWHAAHRMEFQPARVFGSDFLEVTVPAGESGYLEFPGTEGLFNKAPRPNPDTGTLLDAIPGRAAHDVAFFVSSSRGQLYFLGDPSHISLFQREYDGAYPPGGLYAMGRFLLLRVERPSNEVYVRVLASKTSKGQGYTHWSGQGMILGENSAPLRFEGDGAGNVYAGPVRPKRMDGYAYLAIDFGEAPTPFPNHRTGLNRLYHAQIPLDYRRTVAFGRDISLLNTEQFKALAAPRAVVPFPGEAIMDPAFEYSGLYEDGWVSGSAYFALAGPRAGEALEVQGFVPQVGSRRPVHLRFRINGTPLPALAMNPGSFDWLIPVPLSAGYGTSRLAWQCDDAPVLPGEDGRPVSLRLFSARLIPIPSAYRYRAESGPTPFATGVDADGWAEKEVELVLPADPHQRRANLQIDSPQWNPADPRPVLVITVDGRAAVTAKLAPGVNNIAVPLGTGSALREVKIDASAEIQLPGADARRRSYRLIEVSVGGGSAASHADAPVALTAG